jgi:hypothetical protein
MWSATAAKSAADLHHNIPRPPLDVGEGTMTPAETYRMYATIAADLAAEAPDTGRRVSL